MAALAKGATALAAAATLSLSAGVGAANAEEFDILAAGAPEKYVYDDAGALSITTKKKISSQLGAIKGASGVTLQVVTTRKLTVEPDVYSFSETILKKWYPDEADRSNKGVLLIVTSANEGAIAAGPNFQSKISGDLVDSIEQANIPYYCGEEKVNEATTSSVTRIVSSVLGQADPGPPAQAKVQVGSNYKTYEEVSNKRDKYVTVVGGLLVIAFVVPMIQFWGYTK
eukprot:PRCOL_00003436-RA